MQFWIFQKRGTSISKIYILRYHLLVCIKSIFWCRKYQRFIRYFNGFGLNKVTFNTNRRFHGERKWPSIIRSSAYDVTKLHKSQFFKFWYDEFRHYIIRLVFQNIVITKFYLNIYDKILTYIKQYIYFKTPFLKINDVNKNKLKIISKYVF